MAKSVEKKFGRRQVEEILVSRKVEDRVDNLFAKGLKKGKYKIVDGELMTYIDQGRMYERHRSFVVKKKKPVASYAIFDAIDADKFPPTAPRILTQHTLYTVGKKRFAAAEVTAWTDNSQDMPSSYSLQVSGKRKDKSKLNLRERSS